MNSSMIDSIAESPKTSHLADPWLGVLRVTRVKDIIDPNRKLVKTSYEESVSELLKKMSEAKILSAIVMVVHISAEMLR